MALLIDGYNLLHVSDIFAAPGASTELHRARLALLDFLAASIDQRERRETKIVFDAAGAPPGLPHTLMHDGMTVYFARRHSDADELIDELLDRCAAPKGLLVVSSDHRVQRSARQHGACFVDSDKWFGELRAARHRRDADPQNEPRKPDVETLLDEADYWIKQFAESPPDNASRPTTKSTKDTKLASRLKTPNSSNRQGAKNADEGKNLT
jgi:predicted RNA-binding protein with PIN domain